MAADKYDDEFSKLQECELVRHMVSGDAFDGDDLDKKYVKAMLQFHYDNESTQGWTYTHRFADWDDAGLGPEVHPKNLSILASVDSLDNAIDAWFAGWNTARVVSDPAEKHENEEYCPYDLAKHHGKKPAVTCATCQKCWQGKNILFIKL